VAPLLTLALIGGLDMDDQSKPAVGTEPWLAEVFTYHPPDDAQRVAYERIREEAREFARVLLEHTPRCADQSAALRLLRDCVMTANAAIALRGLV
jgi:hypothetical protein